MSGPDTERVAVRRLAPSDEPAVAAFFGRIGADPTAAGFHPHPFTADEAGRIARHGGRDLYLGLFDAGVMVGYGLLRGWDEGYDIPSLGIYLAPQARGRGLSRHLMLALHGAAAANGASRVRLKVYPSNTAAVRLYERMGYVFSGEDAGQRVGLLDLSDPTGAAAYPIPPRNRP